MKVLILTVSDRASSGVYEDLSGPKAVNLIRHSLPDANVQQKIIPDEPEEILQALQEGTRQNNDFIITNGGTGIGPRDVTPDATSRFIQRPIPGIAEAIRADSRKITDKAMLSRGIAGIHGKTIVVNLPGSPNAVESGLSVLIPIMKHAVAMINGGGHEHKESEK